MKRVMILGSDGYIGWALSKSLSFAGISVLGIDNYSRRKLVAEVGGLSVIPIQSSRQREKLLRENGYDFSFVEGDLTDYLFLHDEIKKFKPDTIFHLGQQPSAPYSMRGVREAVFTQSNNIITTLNLIHAVQFLDSNISIVKIACYDDQTEVMTSDGWRFFKDLKYEDEVLCLDPNTEEMKFFVPKEIVQYPYKGRMFRIETRSVDCLVTPNHRVVFRRRVSYGTELVKTPIEVEMADNLPDIHFWIPRGGFWKGEEKEIFVLPAITFRGPGGHFQQKESKEVSMDKWLTFLGLYLSDGFVRYDKKEVPIDVLISVKRQRKVDLLRKTLEELGLSWYEQKPNNQGMVTFGVGGVQLARYLSSIGKCREKFIPKEFKFLSVRQLEILFNSLMQGDGSISKTGTMVYYSKSKKLLEDISEICLKIGLVPRFCDDDYEEGEEGDQYLFIGRKNVDTKISKDKRYWQEYNGNVYCCSVPTGIIMTRRNGKVCWSGNTMGEWGTPNIPISEGWMEIEYKGKKDTVPFPKQPGSFYHCAKVFDSINIELACKIWGLNVTNVYQGVVFGNNINPRRIGSDTIFDSLEGAETRLDVDECFGTVIHRFCAQAIINHPITVYGSGGQKRGFLPLRDSVQCLTLLGNNPAKGYRIVNQFAEIYSINQLAITVLEVLKGMGQRVPRITNFNNPRVEKEEHEYEVEREILKQLGYTPSISLKDEIRNILEDLVEHRKLIFVLKESSLLSPVTKWKKGNL